jgi:hypothetical protein
MSDPISPEGAAQLRALHQEERVARDLYRTFYERYGLPVFHRIAASEQRHMDAVQSLLDRYRLGTTEGHGPHEALYQELLARGQGSLREALSVGVAVEVQDIEDITRDLEGLTDPLAAHVLGRLRSASHNHLDAFSRQLASRGHAVETSLPQGRSGTLPPGLDARQRSGGGPGHGKGRGGGGVTGVGYGTGRGQGGGGRWGSGGQGWGGRRGRCGG